MSLIFFLQENQKTFHGFTEKEIRWSELRSEFLFAQADECREKIWAGQGVALDPSERQVILQHPADNIKVSIKHVW